MTQKLLKAGFKMNPDAVYFVPLGGCGMFGMNMSLYGCRGKWLMVDCGLGFADDNMPGVDILLPDPSFAATLEKNLLGIIITHAHEDHIGGLQYLWPRLKCPVYATPFAATRLEQDFGEMPWGNQARLLPIPKQGAIDLAPFSITPISMAHSIPEAKALAIAVEGVGTILHTGDWKIDDDPVEGDKTDMVMLKRLGDSGVLATVCDSTNAMVPGHSASERTVMKNLAEVFGEFSGHVIIASCFSTNVARLRNIHDAAQENGREVCLVGRSLWKTDNAARQNGYLQDVPPFIEYDEAAQHPAGEIVYICTGSQGEPRAALNRISNEDHPALRLTAGDGVIFSARVIPGNERAIDRMKNRFFAMGVNVVTGHDAPVHVSGHPYRDELKEFYAATRPQISIPVHGERMQLEKHADLAQDCGVDIVVIPENGNVIEITSAGAQVYGQVETGVLAIEGKRIVATDHQAILTRRRMMWNGGVVVSIVADAAGNLLAAPKITALGLLDETSAVDSGIIAEAVDVIEKKIKNMPKFARQNDEEFSETVRIAARRFFHEKFDRKPQTRVHLVRI